MVISHFDTFENEEEMERLIKSLQEKSIEYMKQPNAWEFQCSEINNNTSRLKSL